MKTITRLICTSLLLNALSGALGQVNQTVNLGYATFTGSFNPTTNVTSFLGMRFAEPPTGKLRFQAPVPAGPIPGVTPALEFPAICPGGGEGQQATDPSFLQGLSKRQTIPTSEDCLFLDVHFPGTLEEARAKDLPVVFWIHGGGYLSGSASMYDGTDLINDAGGDVVVVVVQYRLALFGFLGGSEVKQKGALNAGLLDQELALKWVQQHIHSFGGDKSKVTIWGESAGAGSVLQLMVARGGNIQPPLFRAAMTSSTFLPQQFHFNDKEPEQVFQAIVAQAGCGNSTDAFECLVNTDFNTLELTAQIVGGADLFGVFLFVPVVDGEFIQERPVEAILQGKLNGETLLTINNADEGSIFVSPSFVENQTLSEYISNLIFTLDEAQVQTATSLYEKVTGGIVIQANTAMAESIFVCPSYFLHEGFKGTSFRGEFAFPPATHGSDVGVYFQPNARADPASASFAGSFMSLVKTLNPNNNALNTSVTPHWPAYHLGGTEMLFNRTAAGVADVHTFTTDSEVLARCEFWKSVAPVSPQ